VTASVRRSRLARYLLASEIAYHDLLVAAHAWVEEDDRDDLPPMPDDCQVPWDLDDERRRVRGRQRARAAAAARLPLHVPRRMLVARQRRSSVRASILEELARRPAARRRGRWWDRCARPAPLRASGPPGRLLRRVRASIGRGQSGRRPGRGRSVTPGGRALP
jgi:hypothetical protein